MDHYREAQETLVARLRRAEGGRARRALRPRGWTARAAAMLEELAESLGVADRVHFTGGVDHDEVTDYYSLIDVFVVPRTRERAAIHVTPLKPFEAMSLGIPVVVSDLPALRGARPTRRTAAGASSPTTTATWPGCSSRSSTTRRSVSRRVRRRGVDPRRSDSGSTTARATSGTSTTSSGEGSPR